VCVRACVGVCLYHHSTACLASHPLPLSPLRSPPPQALSCSNTYTRLAEELTAANTRAAMTQESLTYCNANLALADQRIEEAADQALDQAWSFSQLQQHFDRFVNRGFFGRVRECGWGGWGGGAGRCSGVSHCWCVCVLCAAVQLLRDLRTEPAHPGTSPTHTITATPPHARPSAPS
jgi:hypothetical protein